MDTLQSAHILAYQANMALAVQQKRSILQAAFTPHSGLKGRLAQFLELVGETTAVINLGRAADTPNIDNQVEPIWVQPAQIVWGKLMELEDVIKSVTDPKSELIQAGAAAMVRAADTMRASAIFGSRRIGQDGGTTSAWAGSTVTVGIGHADDVTAIGMNVKKLLRARRYLQANHVDTGEEQIFFSGNAQAQEELFRDLTFISADYRNKKPLDEPEHVGILGVTILPANDGAAALTDYDGSTFTSALFCRSAMHEGDFMSLTSSIPLRADKLNRPHPQSEHWFGASRSEDKKVVKILNKK